MSINPIHFDLDQSAAADRRRAAPSERSTHRDRRPGHPYPRESAPGSTISRTNSESQISDYITSGLLVYDDLDSIQGGSEGRKKGKQREVPKVEYPPTERAAVDWMRSKLEIDMITVKGWLSMSTDEEKFAVEVYLREVVAQANQKYHCSMSFRILSLHAASPATDFTTRRHSHRCFVRQSASVAFVMSWQACRFV